MGYLSIAFCTSDVIAEIGDFKVEYLREFEAICKKALTRESGAQVGLFDEKTRGRKSHDTVPLRLKYIGFGNIYLHTKLSYCRLI
jgi:hypothetical protein